MRQIEKTSLQDFENCLLLANDEVEIVVAGGFGPRILAYSFVGEENVLGLHPAAQVETALGVWKPYGGHRLWLAPENMPASYAPDNEPVEWSFDETKNSVSLRRTFETPVKIVREMIVTLNKKGSGVEILHKITNLSGAEIECAAWALTIMRGGGEVVIPNEPFAAYGAETLLPVRNLTLWSYTDLTDSRWRFERDAIRLKVDAQKENPQKIGVLNKQGWLAYELPDVVFTKTFTHFENEIYPDLNSNTEIYCAGSFIELETLSPLKKTAPGETLTHRENWKLEKRS